MARMIIQGQEIRSAEELALAIEGKPARRRHFIYLDDLAGAIGDLLKEWQDPDPIDTTVISELFLDEVISAAGMNENERLAALGPDLVQRLDDLYNTPVEITLTEAGLAMVGQGG